MMSARDSKEPDVAVDKLDQALGQISNQEFVYKKDTKIASVAFEGFWCAPAWRTKLGGSGKIPTTVTPRSNEPRRVAYVLTRLGPATS